jgi:hypothetical protein
MKTPLPRAQIHPNKNLSRMIKKKEEKKTLKVTPMMTKTARQTIFLSEPKVRRRQRSWIRSLLGKESRLWRREWQQRYCQFRRWQCLGHQQLQQVVVNQRVWAMKMIVLFCC